MNIFYLSHDPSECAEWMVDKHVVKMIVESAQLLSTAHRILDGTDKVLPDCREQVLYKATHANHPSAIWARQSIENYNWLVDHMFSLMGEYTHRYGKTHKCFGEIGYMLQSPPKNLETWDWTPMPSCMDQQYIISDDPIVNYRNYYKLGKSHIHKWKNRNPPEWIMSEMEIE